MKKYIYILAAILSLSFISCESSATNDDDNMPATTNDATPVRYSCKSFTFPEEVETYGSVNNEYNQYFLNKYGQKDNSYYVKVNGKMYFPHFVRADIIRENGVPTRISAQAYLALKDQCLLSVTFDFFPNDAKIYGSSEDDFILKANNAVCHAYGIQDTDVAHNFFGRDNQEPVSVDDTFTTSNFILTVKGSTFELVASPYVICNK